MTVTAALAGECLMLLVFTLWGTIAPPSAASWATVAFIAVLAMSMGMQSVTLHVLGVSRKNLLELKRILCTHSKRFGDSYEAIELCNWLSGKEDTSSISEYFALWPITPTATNFPSTTAATSPPLEFVPPIPLIPHLYLSS